MNRGVEDDEVVYYCTSCGSLAIIDDGGILKCQTCGSGPSKLDVTTWDRYEDKYEDRIIRPRSVYDDLNEVYEEDTEGIVTIGEAIESGCTVMSHIQRSEKRLLEDKGL